MVYLSKTQQSVSPIAQWLQTQVKP